MSVHKWLIKTLLFDLQDCPKGQPYPKTKVRDFCHLALQHLPFYLLSPQTRRKSCPGVGFQRRTADSRSLGAPRISDRAWLFGQKQCFGSAQFAQSIDKSMAVTVWHLLQDGRKHPPQKCKPGILYRSSKSTSLLQRQIQLHLAATHTGTRKPSFPKPFSKIFSCNLDNIPHLHLWGEQTPEKSPKLQECESKSKIDSF